MFTGLIEAVGVVDALQQQPEGTVLTIQAETIAPALNIGDSIAIDGACMTVVSKTDRVFTVEVSPESLRRTTFQTFKVGTLVNLERPLTPVSPIGGHYVTGHVDGLATLVEKMPDGISVRLVFQMDSPALAEYLIPKGSVAVSGVSLTVNTVDGDTFSVAIIPHTLANTTLGCLEVGQAVNIETDLLGKYVKKFLGPVLHDQHPPGFDSAAMVD